MPQTAVEKDRTTPKAPTLLLIEPSRLLRGVIASACGAHDIAVVVETEIGAALTHIAREKPSAVLTALELPGLSGAALVGALKSCPFHRAIPIGLLTTSELIECQMPIRPDVIISKDANIGRAVLGFLGRLGLCGEQRAATRGEPGLLMGRRVLLAEDATFIHKLLGKFLHVAGADVMVVENGVDAVAATGKRTFDVILMDIEMPQMDGRDATRAIRNRGIKTPIIAITANDVTAFRVEAASLGFDAVLAKPVSREALIDACAMHAASLPF